VEEDDAVLQSGQRTGIGETDHPSVGLFAARRKDLPLVERISRHPYPRSMFDALADRNEIPQQTAACGQFAVSLVDLALRTS
jgi:hypothetical protein